MVNTKKLKLLLFLSFVILFPFGQLLRYQMNLAGIGIVFHPIDFLVGICGIMVLVSGNKFPPLFRHLTNFYLAAFFSLVLSIPLFGFSQVVPGILYFLRLIFYGLFFVFVLNLSKKTLAKEKIFEILIILSTVISVSGIFQYILLPDVRFLKFLGWDDHLYRIVGTFFDPGYTSILIVLGILLAIVGYINLKRKLYIPVLLIDLLALAFTYSRSGFLALAAGIFTLALIYKKFKLILVLILMAFAILLLPRPSSEGARLERTVSIFARSINYQETLKIGMLNPLFGVGFNNMCPARLCMFGGDARSHACAGADSSILFIWATTGLVGLALFLNFIFQAGKYISGDLYAKALISVSSALLIHSLFNNSLFYSWVMGYLAILQAISIKE